MKGRATRGCAYGTAELGARVSLLDFTNYGGDREMEGLSVTEYGR